LLSTITVRTLLVRDHEKERGDAEHEASRHSAVGSERKIGGVKYREKSEGRGGHS